MIGVFERGIGVAFLLEVKAGRSTFEYWKQNKATSGRSAASINDLDGMVDLLKI
jgi:hypothetical protein